MVSQFDPRPLGEYVRNARKRRGLNQDAVRERGGPSKGWLGALEGSRDGVPHVTKRQPARHDDAQEREVDAPGIEVEHADRRNGPDEPPAGDRRPILGYTVSGKIIFMTALALAGGGVVVFVGHGVVSRLPKRRGAHGVGVEPAVKLATPVKNPGAGLDELKIGVGAGAGASGLRERLRGLGADVGGRGGRREKGIGVLNHGYALQSSFTVTNESVSN